MGWKVDRGLGQPLNEQMWRLESVHTGKQVTSLSANQKIMSYKGLIVSARGQGDPVVGTVKNKIK
jgi:hypothetical protein